MGLKNKTITGLFWAFVSQGGRQVANLVIVALLARMLRPDDFGLLAMAAVFTNYAAIFRDMGISSAIIQRQNVEEKHLSSAFWLNVFAGFILTVIFIAVSPLISRFYGRPELGRILVVMSLNFILASFTIVQQSILVKEMDFRKLAIRDIGAIIAGGIFGIYFAWRGSGVWSLVYQLLVTTIANNILLWSVSSWRPRFMFSLQAIKDIFNFSAHLTAFNAVNYFSRNIDQLLIGRFLGAQALGYYSLAYKIMLYPVQNISGVITRVVFPAFSKIQNEHEKIRATYLKMVKSIALVVFPLMIMIFSVSPELVRMLLGDKWEPAVVIIRILCFCGLIQAVGGPIVGNIRLSQGRTDIHLRLGIINTLAASLAIIIGLKWGLVGVSVSYTVYSYIWAFYTNYVTLPLIGLKMGSYISALKRPAMLSMALIFILLLVEKAVPFDRILKMTAIGISGSMLYFLSLLYFREVSIKGKRICLNFLE